MRAQANTSHHHLSGADGADGADTDADCLRWEEVVVSVTATPAEGGQAGAAGAAGTAEVTGIPVVTTRKVCAEHATLFGCDCALGRQQKERGSAAAIGAALSFGLTICRRRRSRQPHIPPRRKP
jgi:hypothetical protein